MFGKIFASMFDGSLRGHAHAILVFTNMIAKCDRHGICDRHWRAIADDIGLTAEQVRAATDFLEAKDPESRSKEEGGARIAKLDPEGRGWGWRIVNYQTYRDIACEQDRRDADRIRKAKARNDCTMSAPVRTCPQLSAPVRERPHESAMSAQAEAEAEAEAEGERGGSARSPWDDLRDAIKASGGALTKSGEDLWPEWVAAVKGHHREWVLLQIPQIRAEWPGELRKAIKAKKGEEDYWKASRKGTTGP